MTVAGAVIERDGGLLLVKNRRRDGAHDWSTPGGVVDPTDATLVAGLAREVEEETGLQVQAWEGPLYEVVAVATDMGWELRCEVHRAVEWSGDIVVDDPDGIVVDAAFVEPAAVADLLTECFEWVGDPLRAWLTDRWGPSGRRRFRYEVTGTSLSDLRVVAASVE
jgi:8-oxo-dGTP diphosphatase